MTAETPDELAALGHKPMTPLRALRLRCLDCCCGQPAEVRKCPATSCPSWPFRFGRSPWRKPPGEARREASRRAAQKARSARKILSAGKKNAPGEAKPH